MSDELQTGAPADTGSTAEGALVPADSQVGTTEPTTGLAPLAPDTALDSAASVTGDLDAILAAIPTDDSDLEPSKSQPHYQALIDQRRQLRKLSATVRELTPLRELAKLGSPKALQGKLQLANLLYSPLLDPATKQPRIDPTTQTPYTTTAPFIQYLDKNSPGMPEQLLADLLDYSTVVNGQPRKLSLQVLDYWDGKFPGWWKQRYGAQIAPVSGTVTPEELAAIPSEYHEAYQAIPFEVRSAWSAYDKSTQTRMLEDYKDKVETAKAKEADKATKAARDVEEAQRLQAYISQEQNKYFDRIRRERFSAISQTLAKQLTFSEDAATNSIMHGSIGTILWNLIDPDGRFIAEETILKPMGVRLDASFDAALNRFNSNAANAVAYAIAGDNVKAGDCEAESTDAADQLVAKLGVIAIEIAKRMGAKQATAATNLGNALTTATTSRPSATIGTSQPTANTGNLPAGMRPDSPEALQYIAQQSKFVAG